MSYRDAATAARDEPSGGATNSWNAIRKKWNEHFENAWMARESCREMAHLEETLR
jgi:hypothetical protein